jgi:D-alanine-D-alanine ligase
MKRIAVLGGGNQSEFVISVKSAGEVANALDRKRFEVFVVQMKGNDWSVLMDNATLPIDRNDFSFNLNGQKLTFDCAVIVIHGSPGEDGRIQAYLELVGIPYTTCGVLCSAITFNKHACKTMLLPENVKMAKGKLIRRGDKVSATDMVKELGLPMFMKPNEAGSSFGVTKITDVAQIDAAIDHALTEGNEVLAESFISGREITCGVGRIGGKLITFPITEIVSKKEFFDYEAKYTTGLSEEITPAAISAEMTARCNKITADIYTALNCRGIVRIDFIISNDEFYFLEINTVPGMSPNSIIPQQIRVMGKTVTEVYSQIIDEAIAGTL